MVNGLCSVYACATLSASAIAQLKAAERSYPDVVFVAYASPLRKRAAGERHAFDSGSASTWSAAPEHRKEE